MGFAIDMMIYKHLSSYGVTFCHPHHIEYANEPNLHTLRGDLKQRNK